MTNMLTVIDDIEHKVMEGIGIDVEEAQIIATHVNGDESQLEILLALTEKVTAKFFNGETKKCTDGFTGTACPNSCAFCYMSMYKGEGDMTNYQYSKQNGLLPRALKSAEAFLEDAVAKEKAGATHYKIVGPEYKLPERNFELALAGYELIHENTNLMLCASMGTLDLDHMKRLRDAGVDFYNHNLERANWDSLNSAFELEGRIETNKRAKQVGMKRCTGLIAGMGEDLGERIKTIFMLQDIDVESLPFNVFVPPRPEMQVEPPPKIDVLLSLALCRLALPKAEITLNNGNHYFIEFWGEAFKAGATGFGLKGAKDRPSFLPHGRVDNPPMAAN